jgi:GAF domain-containing protein
MAATSGRDWKPRVHQPGASGLSMNETWRTFLAALAAPNQPAPVFLALETIVRDEVGARLFTLMTFDARTGLSRRVHSSHPREYPVSGSKPLSVGVWSRTVIDERRTFVANTIEAIAEVFPDHEVIHSLGCGSVVNLPVVFSGEVVGVANALDAPGHYTPDRVERIERLSPFVTVALLAARLAQLGCEPAKEDRRS